MLSDHYDWQTSRIGILDDRVGSHCGVFRLHLRVGTAKVFTAGVDCVVTHEEHRGRGFMRATLGAAVYAIKERCYGLSILLGGVDGFYSRFGYVAAWPECNFHVEVADLPPGSSDIKIEEFTPTHREDLANLYNRWNETRTGTAVRPTYSDYKWAGHDQGYLWRDGSGPPEGYLVGERGPSDDPFMVVDSAGNPDDILLVAGLLARRSKLTRILFHRLSSKSELGKRLCRTNAKLEADYKTDGGFMIRITSLPALLETVIPLLAERLRQSPYSSWNGDLVVSTTREQVALQVADSRMQIAPVQETEHAIEGREEIAQLVLGSEEPDEIVGTSGTVLRGDALKLLRTLFPVQHPHIAAVDL